MTIFNGGSVPKKLQFCMIFAPQHCKNCKTYHAEILQENCFLQSLQVHQLSLKSEKMKMKIALFCDDFSWSDSAGDLFLNVCETMKELKLPWTRLKGVTTDGAPCMIGKKTCLMGGIRQEMDKENPKLCMELHCIIHQQSLCRKTLKFEHVLKVMASVANFVQSHGLHHHQFQSFLSEIEAEYGDILCHADVRWLSHGTVLKCFYSFRPTNINVHE
jgi:hypothetical protein